MVAVNSRRVRDNFPAAGNCYETAIAVGMLLALDEDRNVRLVRSVVRIGIVHWWLLVDNAIVDPTADQFQPKLMDAEYYQDYRLDGMDLRNLARWAGLHR